MLSTELYLIAMLDEYIAPKPMVDDFVRTQLLRHEKNMAIQQAVQQTPHCCRQVLSGCLGPLLDLTNSLSRYAREVLQRTLLPYVTAYLDDSCMPTVTWFEVIIHCI